MENELRPPSQSRAIRPKIPYMLSHMRRGSGNGAD
eukprot:CAMPEP_0117500080 /NCGR_PEP_ID=MMETSP0784-20121206/22588_1 /TAXON_ID=39447 /ORGANISM="" /LENGTH=34 /DNA_ID= /DNA_START= /DNA_END= /DNA_ORIENTATION=